MIGQPVFTSDEAYDYHTMALNMRNFTEELVMYVNNPERKIICDIFQIWDGSYIYLYKDKDDVIEWDEDIEWNADANLVSIGTYDVDPWTTPILTNECLSCYVNL